MKGRYGVTYQLQPEVLPQQLSSQERADLRPLEGEDLVRYFQRIGTPRQGEQGQDIFAPVLPDMTSTITDGERYLFSRYGDPLEREHAQYGENVERVLDLPIVPRSLVEVQIGAEGDAADRLLAAKLEGYEGGDLTPRQYLRLAPFVEVANALRRGDFDAYAKLAPLRNDPDYTARIQAGAIEKLKAPAGTPGPPESAFAVASLINALERGGPQGEYADPASVTESEWKENLATNPGGRYALMTEGAQKNASRQVAADFLRAMQDGDYRPKSATWVSNTISTMSAALGDMKAGERANIQNFNSPFAYRAYVANENLRNSQLLNGGPTSLIQNGAMAVDQPYVWDGIAAVMSRNPQYPVAGALQPINTRLRNAGTILDDAKPGLAAAMSYADNRFSRTQPIRPNAQSPEDAERDRLDALRYNQGMSGFYGAAIEPSWNAAENKLRRIVGLGNAPRQYAPRAAEMAVSMPDAFKSNAWSLGALTMPTVGAGFARAGAAGGLGAMRAIPSVMAGEVGDELKEEFGNQILETGSVLQTAKDFFGRPQVNAYNRVPETGILRREMTPLFPSSDDFDAERKKSQQYYYDVLDRQRQSYGLRQQ